MSNWRGFKGFKGEKGSICYSLIPGAWSPCLEEAVLLEWLEKEGKVKVRTASGKVITTHQGNFLARKDQGNKSIQLTLF